MLVGVVAKHSRDNKTINRFEGGKYSPRSLVPYWKVAADMESLSASFDVMLGSAEKSKKLVDELIQFAAKTPFQIHHLSLL